MKVLWILNGCGLEGREITGAPVRFHEISRRFAARGVDQQVMTTPGGAMLLETLGSKEPRVVVAASIFLKREPCRAFRFWSYLVSAFAGRRARAELRRADVVISVSDYFCDVAPALAIRRRWSARWIAWTHHAEGGSGARSGRRLTAKVTRAMQNWSYRRIACFADLVGVLDSPGGDESAERLLAFGLAAARLRRMRNGVDFSGIRATPKPATQAVDAVLVGIRPGKGLSDILPIWRRVLELRPRSTLQLMGGMSGCEGLLGEIKRTGLGESIRVFRPQGGFLTGAAYWEKLKEAKVLFAPSPWEGWGIVVCEAMAASVAVVAYDLATYQRIYPGAYEAIPCGDREAFARAIVRILDDEQRRANLCAEGLKTAARYDWEAIAEQDYEVLG